MTPDYSFRNIRLYNCDCMEFMKDIPDNFYELAIVDPPYGIGMNGGKRGKAIYIKKNWDKIIPSQQYFIELFRISQNQIIWGGNYYMLPSTPCVIIWDKKNGNSFFGDGEIAWTSFKSVVKILPLAHIGRYNAEPKKIHPTQKPVNLYNWLLSNYAQKGDKIFDSHGGSFSSACACLDMGFEFDGCEIDSDYFESAVKRIKNHNQEYIRF